jgi:hypothetical protein
MTADLFDDGQVKGEAFHQSLKPVTKALKVMGDLLDRTREELVEGEMVCPSGCGGTLKYYVKREPRRKMFMQLLCTTVGCVKLIT